MTKKLFILLAVSLSFCLAGSAQAVTKFSFTPVKISVKAGQTFSLKIGINPNDVRNYTIKTSLKFPADLVSFKTWTYAADWMPLKKSNYDSNNNTTGVLIKTAGYPNGFSTTTSFGTAVFTAIKSGTGVITFASDGLALNADNANLYGGGNQVAVVISSTTTTPTPTPTPVPVPIPVPTPTPTPTPVPTPIPTPTPPVVVKLFDIVLSLENALLNASSDLVAWTQFTSFGTVPTPVNMVYRIEDASGSEVYSENSTVTVETEQMVTKDFINLTLGNGKYTLFLTTTYGANVQDEFRQAFEVRAATAVKEKTATITWIIWAVVALIIIALGWFVVLQINKRQIKKGGKHAV